MRYNFNKKYLVIFTIFLFLFSSFAYSSVGNKIDNFFLINQSKDIEKQLIEKNEPEFNDFKDKDQLYGIKDEFGIIKFTFESELKLNENKIDDIQHLRYQKIYHKTAPDYNGHSNNLLENKKSNMNPEIIKNTKNANILYVGGSGPNNYSKIQDAINSSSNGDTVFVYDDSSPYYENLIITKEINLIGENRETTIIDGSRIDPDLDTINVTADNVIITGFSITNNFGEYYQGSILLKSDYVKIYNCNIYSNGWIGIYLLGADSCEIYDCEIYENLISIYLINSDENKIFDNYFYENAEDIMIFDVSHHNQILNCTCIGNSYSGIHIQRSTGNIVKNCTIQDGNGGIGLAYAPNTVLQENIINNNMENFGIGSNNQEDFFCEIDTSNKINGEPIYFWKNINSQIVPSDASFIALVQCNDIDISGFNLTNNFQGIVCAGSSNISIENCDFLNNDGHGVFFVGSQGSIISDCQFQESFFSGVYLISGSNGNTVLNCSFSKIAVNNIWAEQSTDSKIYENIFGSGSSAVALERSGNTILIDNEMFSCGMRVEGAILADYINDVDSSNKINEKTIYYYVGESGITVPSDAGQVILVNCSNIIVSNLELSDGTIAVELAFSKNNVISENTISSNYVAIDLDCQGNDFNTIISNTIQDNSYGIDVDISDNNEFINNILESNRGTAFSLDSSKNNKMIGNEISDSNNGFYLYSSNNNQLEKNKINDCGSYAIYLLYSSSNKLMENDMNNCGFLIYGNSLSQYINDIDTTNKVNKKTLYFYIGKDGITVPPDAGEVVLVNCINCNVKNLNLSGGTIGCQLAFSDENTISGNRLENNVFAGLYIESSSKNMVEKNKINANSYGIDMQLADENIIQNNKIQENNYGFYIYLSNTNTISNNNIYFNTIGIRINRPSNQNLIHHNNLIDNGLNGYDQNKNTNNWDDGKKGNYWSDYTNRYPDAGKIWLKGIWNTAYEIEGQENKDKYPLVLPSINPRTKTIYSNQNHFSENPQFLSKILEFIFKGINVIFQ